MPRIRAQLTAWICQDARVCPQSFPVARPGGGYEERSESETTEISVERELDSSDSVDGIDEGERASGKPRRNDLFHVQSQRVQGGDCKFFACGDVHKCTDLRKVCDIVMVRDCPVFPRLPSLAPEATQDLAAGIDEAFVEYRPLVLLIFLQIGYDTGL